jgi:hypothetical protein
MRRNGSSFTSDTDTGVGVGFDTTSWAVTLAASWTVTPGTAGSTASMTGRTDGSLACAPAGVAGTVSAPAATITTAATALARGPAAAAGRWGVLRRGLAAAGATGNRIGGHPASVIWWPTDGTVRPFTFWLRKRR